MPESPWAPMYQVRPPSALATGAWFTSARETFSPAVNRTRVNDALPGYGVVENSDATFAEFRYYVGKMETLLTNHLFLEVGYPVKGGGEVGWEVRGTVNA